MIENLFLTLLISSFSWIILLALIFFSRIKVPERLLSESLRYLSIFFALISVTIFFSSLLHAPSFLLLDFKDWISIGEYHFKLRFVVDLLGSTYAFLSCALIGLIFRFSRNYLHREEGYFRFVFLLSTLLFGLLIVSFARSLDLLFAGWELVGTTSVLLISYFFNKPQPVAHALKAIVSYRLCDMGILAASAWAHHHVHSTDFFLIPVLLNYSHHSASVVVVGGFVIWASLAKAGLLPMTSWLPAAMEGPTPSSAIFYGALSVHLGPFLLLRFYDFFSHFPILLFVIGLIGATTAVYASLVARTRSDAKTMLAYATISQVGIIYIEIALGFTRFALFHIVTHASFRTYQFLRSSSLIQDFVENPVLPPNRPIRRKIFFERAFPINFRRRFFIHALHGFHLDYLTDRFIKGVLYPFKMYLILEERWMELDTLIFRKIFRRVRK
jgi:NADH-quinone oxidoreductase subunit L